MQAKELKQKYLEFFKSKGHAIIPSASLIPVNDPTVLFNTAGMQPLAPYLTGEKHPQGKRLADVQKCLRTVDFENIGDDTHHTFFEMLGNWSLGDYFKEDAIKWSFEFLTSKEWLGLPLSKLAFTVYKGEGDVPKDSESASIWESLGVSKDRIAFLGSDNFWIAGEAGPCGPSSEMFYWTGDSDAPVKFDEEDERWVEIWNDVFMAYNKSEDGSITKLKQQNVDTGMGLERTAAVLLGKKSAYETDLFQPIIKKIVSLSGKDYEDNKKAMRIIADHLRAATFVLAEGLEPSNTDRGYILRRLIRRAIRFGKQLGITTEFTSLIAEVVVSEYCEGYPELKENKNKIISELQKEEKKFEITLEKGLREFEKMATKGNLSGEDAFLLFQSYGFPLEMTEELADERKVKVDAEQFFAAYERHQKLSRTATEGKFKGGLADLSDESVKLHTATHLLNEALRKVVSSDIKQRGSNITPERLRFDFTFDRKLTDEEKKAVEDEVNKVINADLKVVRKEMLQEEAAKLGAQAEFGKKYPDTVSVYLVGDYSIELCGGPHVNSTKEIGHFKIVKEQSSSAGVRRIKAVIRTEGHG
ncbi:alanine--tRNA ligase [Candidatus Woesearchaeota archaeon]|nr:alanine--tRNA ligase [Candidatus Woesearchaeota archaeon]